jgi:repressor LexA
MIDAAIVDGDWVVVSQHHKTEHGEIVAAMIEGEATVKTLRLDVENKQVWLLPRTSAYLPMYGEDVTILGRRRQTPQPPGCTGIAGCHSAPWVR